MIRGYSDEDLFSLDDTISRFILPRLKAFRECLGGYNDNYFNNIEVASRHYYTRTEKLQTTYVHIKENEKEWVVNRI